MTISKQATSHTLLFDLLFVFLVVLSLALHYPTVSILVACCIAPFYAWSTGRAHLLPYFVIAIIFSSLWLVVGYAEYGYGGTTAMPFGLPLYPFFAWAVGLFGLRALLEHAVQRRVKRPLLLFIVLYWVALIGLEAIAYHLFGIHNAQTAMYPGLPLCDCMHAPRWMQAVYLLMGPVYLLVCAAWDRIAGPAKLRNRKVRGRSQTS